jgi:hypothetical protein
LFDPAEQMKMLVILMANKSSNDNKVKKMKMRLMKKTMIEFEMKPDQANRKYPIKTKSKMKMMPIQRMSSMMSKNYLTNL